MTREQIDAIFDITIPFLIIIFLDYSRALIATSSIPAIGQPLLRHRLVELHQDIVMCMNFQDTDNVSSFLSRTRNSFQVIISKLLNGVDFRQLLLYVVQDMRNKEDTKSYESVMTRVES